ncbi:MAG: Gfo/Idh/MocA family protein [Candidatus Dormibacteria bacterium]
MRFAFVGCGHISEAYAKTLQTYPQVQLAGAFDVDAGRARTFTETWGGQVFASLDDALADPEVEGIINLTVPGSHYEVTRRSLEAGKHVHSEKPFASSYRQCADLLTLAKTTGVRLTASPTTALGEAQQTAWKALRDGRCGSVRAVYAEVNHGRIESWHPRPQALYEVGPLVDVGVYPLTLLTTFLGRVSRVWGHARILLAERTTLDGTPFTVRTPDWVQAVIELDSGVCARLTTTFYVGSSRQRGLEFHGDGGSLHLGSFQEFDAPVTLATRDGKFRKLAPVRPPFEGIDWGRGVADLADAVAEDRPTRVSATQAAHVVEVMSAILESAREEGRGKIVGSTFEAPAPMEWAL